MGKRYCPMCESVAKPIVAGVPNAEDLDRLRTGQAVRISTSLPWIEPTHFCSYCSTFFMGNTRYYVTGRGTRDVAGVSVWPHGRKPLRVESGDEGLVAIFHTEGSILIPDERPLLEDLLWRSRESTDLVGWARRRGFRTEVYPAGPTEVSLRLRPGGPKFGLIVAKEWLRDNFVHSLEDASLALEDAGIEAVILDLGS